MPGQERVGLCGHRPPGEQERGAWAGCCAPRPLAVRPCPPPPQLPPLNSALGVNAYGFRRSGWTQSC